jgi:drug/metabolite transporter (DMT)-like permease
MSEMDDFATIQIDTLNSNLFYDMNPRASDTMMLFSMLCFYAGCIVWFGSLMFFGIGVASVIFKILPSKDLAGALNGVILHRLNMLELAGATLIGIGIALVASRVGGRDIRTSALLLVLMLGALCAYALVITAEMNTLRAQINSFDAPSTASLALVQKFRTLHQWYSRLVSGNIMLGLLLFVLQTRLYLRLASYGN